MNRRTPRHFIILTIALTTLVSTKLSASSQLKVYLIRSLVWEGRPFAKQNVDALKELRKGMAKEPFTHFISASYFTRKSSQSKQVKETLSSFVKENDVVGLHVTAWQSEVEKAGLIFRDGPTFFGHSLHPDHCSSDCGQEIPPSSYPFAEAVKLIQSNKDVLEKQGFTVDSSHVQGWMATPQILAALRKAQFYFDYSGVAPQIVKSKLNQYPIYPWIESNWKDRAPLQQPYSLSTEFGELIQVGNFLASIDYVSPVKHEKLFKELVERSRSLGSDSVVFHMSLRFESIFDRSKQFIEANQRIKDLAAKLGVELIPFAFSGVKETRQKIQIRKKVNVRVKGAL